MTEIQTISQNFGDLNTMISNLETTANLYVKQPLSTLYYDGSNVFNPLNNIGIGTITERELTEDDVKNEINLITNRLAELIDIIIKNEW